MSTKQNQEGTFNTAVEITDSKRQEAYLEQACAEDDKLQAQVEALLKWHVEAGDLLEIPAVDSNVTLETSASREDLGADIGRRWDCGRDAGCYSSRVWRARSPTFL